MNVLLAALLSTGCATVAVLTFDWAFVTRRWVTALAAAQVAGWAAWLAVRLFAAAAGSWAAPALPAGVEVVSAVAVAPLPPRAATADTLIVPIGPESDATAPVRWAHQETQPVGGRDHD